MSKKGFWWASIDGREPQVVEVGDLTTGHEVVYVTGLEVEIELDEVSLIERVLPGGRGYTGPVTVDVDGKGRVTVQRQDGIYAWEAEGARRVNDVAGSQIIALVLGGMALERMSRENGGDFVHPNWTELFDGPEAYFRWRDAQGEKAAAAP